MYHAPSGTRTAFLGRSAGGDDSDYGMERNISPSAHETVVRSPHITCSF
jgi:hypothetical protein